MPCFFSVRQTEAKKAANLIAIQRFSDRFLTLLLKDRIPSLKSRQTGLNYVDNSYYHDVTLSDCVCLSNSIIIITLNTRLNKVQLTECSAII